MLGPVLMVHITLTYTPPLKNFATSTVDMVDGWEGYKNFGVASNECS